MDRRTFLKTFSFFILTQGLSANEIVRATEAPVAPVNDSTGTAFTKNRQTVSTHDIRLPKSDWPVFLTSLDRFSRIQATVGFGNFCILGFDQSLRIAKNYAKVGAFTRQEIEFIDKLFNTDAGVYGFLGKKTFHSMSDTIAASKIKKTPGTGNYLFNGLPQQLYHKISHDIGDQVVLTAGIRGMAKQFYLFLRKVKQTQGNLSLASRSIAPPGYSFHGVSDFDVGQVGFGAANFTTRFSNTKVYKKMTQLGYIDFRYPQNNRLGVRFEPWHIKVV
ncbi:MAG: M15 family metallopeptidase [Desulfobacterales bacterium]|nr:M15 family metallopeptidase [Desulfobacterales bacterium]MDX2511102.1 M15 family metallopeptidase [Desulfobacterales bacterium]